MCRWLWTCGLRVWPLLRLRCEVLGRTAFLNLQAAASVHATLSADLGLAGAPSAPGLPHVRLSTESAL